MTQKELRNLAMVFVRDEIPHEFEDCIGRVLDRFPKHLQAEKQKVNSLISKSKTSFIPITTTSIVKIIWSTMLSGRSS